VPTRRSRPPFRRLLRWAALACVGGGLLGALVLAGIWWNTCRDGSCPSVDVLDQYVPQETSKVYAADGRLITELGLERRTVVRLEALSQPVRDAFLITEDRRFYEHGGIDYRRIVGAVIRNIQAGGFAQGFSTITMQLARNVFPDDISREKTITRKLKEAKVALAIERRFEKDRILELYLNQIYLGAGAYGIEAAAQRYFGKSAKDLNVADAALLAALPKAPERYNPRRFPERAVQRRNVILTMMEDQGVLSAGEASLARAWPLALGRPGTAQTEVAPYFVEWVRQRLQERFGPALYSEGLEIHTTLDLDLQIAAERSLEAQLQQIESGRLGRFRHVTYADHVQREGDTRGDASDTPYLQGAFVALDPRSGEVRALIGGRDFEDSKFNRATQALRQPGSTFKPLVYATALRAGHPVSEVLDDSPLEMAQPDGTTWRPQNYDLTFSGPVPMREALYQSRNLPAIRMGMAVGEASVVDMARRFGITTPMLPVPAIHLGAADVYPLEMIAAYSVFANLGTRVEPQPIRRVLRRDGTVLWAPKPERETVLSTEEAWLMTDMLRDVVRRGTAYGAVVVNGRFTHPAGGKTGTTNEYSDVWFIGYTADLVAGVWVGFDRPKRIMDNAQGGRLAAPAWTAFMNDAYRRKPAPPAWPRPSTLVAMDIDRPTGLRRGLCSAERSVTEWFIPGTEPVDLCLPGVLDALRRPRR
jgi:penicillin-binding protein 1A